jgi:hypothetical protein
MLRRKDGWNAGIMEEWNDGSVTIFHHPNIPITRGDR